MNTHLDIHANSMPYISTPAVEDQSQAHLSEDQIDDQLIGDLAAGPAAHLAVCIACADRVAAAADPIVGFGAATLAWSERRSATLPIPSFSHTQALRQQRIAWTAACCAVVLGIALTNASHQVVPRTAETQLLQQAKTQQAVVTAPALIQTASLDLPPRPQQIAADNQMLKAIGNEIDASTDDNSAAALGLEPVSVRSNRSHISTSLQD